MKIQTDTITAIATPNGIGALAVIRLSGSDSHFIFQKCIKEKDIFGKIGDRIISLLTIKDEDEVVDEITAIKYTCPKSYTGENMVEIICHGGKITVNEIIRKLIQQGARIAQRGEFTRRAFNNGKIDVLKAEAIRGIIESTSLIENRNALNAYYGQSYKKIELLKRDLINVISDVESEIEFSEEEDVKENNKNSMQLTLIKDEIEKEIKKREVIKEVGKGIKILIAGPPNAGKSTLYNKILGYDRSIINEKPGTTRDLITEQLDINNKTVTIIDSAGIRSTVNSIEREGIKKSEEELKEASVIIWISSANEKISKDEINKIKELREKKTVFIINKVDTESFVKEDYYKKEKISFIKTSLINNSIENIEKEIIKHVADITNSIEINDFIINERHELIVREVYKKVVLSINHWDKKEIASIYLNEALKEIENLSGKIGSQEILNNIFDKFCIGK
jgi:tRNA modification GTPase